MSDLIVNLINCQQEKSSAIPKKIVNVIAGCILFLVGSLKA